tara:strand:- start:23617 stop:24015 length:399 start_codon:yes stop_codon:yes gene_type:complete
LKKGLFVAFTILLTSCSSDNGHQIVGDQLTVYFDNAEDETLAEKIAFYWKDNDLLTGEKQDLKIIRADDEYVLKIIASNPKQTANMPFEELKLLLELESDLNLNIQKVGKRANYPIEIVICDNQFEPIYNID